MIISAAFPKHLRHLKFPKLPTVSRPGNNNNPKTF